MAKRKPLKIVAGTYDANGYATATPTGFREFEPTDTFDAAHIEQDATHRFLSDAKSADWDSKEPGNANIQAHVISTHAPANAQKNSDITKAEIEAKLTGEISSHTHAGSGSETDPVAMAALSTHTASHAPANATANDTDANLKNRANHTGTQPASTISDFSTAADARIAAASVNALSDVAVAAPVVGQVLKWNGTAWVNDTDATGGGGGSSILTSIGTPNTSTTSNTTGVSTGIAFALAVGEYFFNIILRNTSAATTTSPLFSLQGTGGLVVASLDLVANHIISAIAGQTGNANALAGWTAGTTGTGTTARPTHITARVRVTAPGTITLWMRSEVSASAVTMIEGSGYAIKL